MSLTSAVIQEIIVPSKTFFFLQVTLFNLDNSWILFLLSVLVFSKSSCNHPFFQRFRVNFATTVTVNHLLEGCFSIVREQLQIYILLNRLQ